MARRDIVNDPIRYTIADDELLPADLATWAVLRTRVIDELTLAPPHNPLRLRSNLTAATARIGDGGYCGLVARPRDVSSALLTPGALIATVEAANYLSRDLTPAIETARRTLNTFVAFGTTNLEVLPPDTVPPLQFRAGRGVLLARPVPTDSDQFTTVAATPPLPTAVPLADGANALRPVGARVVGVPLVLPTQALHRAEPLPLRVHLRRRTGPTSIIPAAGAEIGIAGIWLAYPHTQTQPPIAADFCALSPSLRFSHPVGAPIHRCSLNAVGAPRRLGGFAPLGAEHIVVAPNGGLNSAGGDLLRLGDPLTPEMEIVVSAGFEAVVDPNAAVMIRLTAPTAFLHRPFAMIRDINVVGSVVAGTVGREALAGDAVLFAAGIAALPTASAIAVEHGSARAAYYAATQYPAWDGVNFGHQVALDPAGRAFWPPLARVAQLRIFARHPAHPAQQIDFALDQRGDNAIAVVFS